MTWDVERMREVVQEWDAAVRAALPAYARLVPEAEARGSVLRPAASESQIAEAELRLAVNFPPSYRAFLAISNGADASRWGADHVLRWYGERRGALCGTETLRHFSDWNDSLIPMWLESFREFADRQEPPSEREPTEVMDFEPGLQALALTAPEQDNTLALVPFEGEWQVWDFGHSEVDGYLSFAEFLLDRTRWARQQLADREAVLEADPATRDPARYAEALAESGDDHAVEAACRLVESGNTRGLPLLVMLGDPRAIPTLRAVYAEARAAPPGHPLWNAYGMAIWGLQSCGDPWVVDELKRLAAAEPDRAWAKLLEQHEDLVRW